MSSPAERLGIVDKVLASQLRLEYMPYRPVSEGWNILLPAQRLGMVDKVPASQLRLEYMHTGRSVEAEISCYRPSGWE